MSHRVPPGFWEQPATKVPESHTAEKWVCYLAALSFQSVRLEQVRYIGSTLTIRKWSAGGKGIYRTDKDLYHTEYHTEKVGEG